MNEKTMNGKKAFKIALPVLIGLVLIALITLTISIASKPDYNAQVEDPNGAYLKLDKYVITNEKMYVNLRYNYGVSDMVAYVDKILLKDVKVDRNSEEYLAVKNKLIYGEDYEELTAKEKEEKLEEFNTTLAIAGYEGAEVDEYFDLEYRRTAYAKEAYKEYVKENKFDATTLKDAYLEINKEKYNDTADAIVVTFDSEKEALEILDLFGIDTENLSTSANWKNKEGKTLTELEIHKIFVDMYNFMNAFFNGGNVSDYYDETGALDPKYRILVEDIHYEVVEKDLYLESSEDNKNTQKVITILDDVDEAKQNANCKLTYTEDEATEINATLKTYLFTTLKHLEDSYFYNTYTQKPVAMTGSNNYFLAVLLDRYEAPDLEYDFDEEVDENLKAPSDDILAEINDYLAEEKFNNDIITQMLLELRAKNNFVIYDNFLEAMYKGSYDYLYGTTLKIEDYPEFKINKKNSKTLVFTLTPENGEKVEVSAQEFFELLNAGHGPQTALSLMANHYVLSDSKFNELYNHVTGEIYDEEAFKEAINNSVKNIKYYFNAGYYASNGFTAEYGWNNFLHDYLRMDNEYELVLNAAGMEDAFKKYYETTYNYESVLATMKELYASNYYALKVINVLVYTDYNHDGTPDDYELNEDKENTYWTENQETLTKELIEKLYQVAPSTGEDGLYNQLVAVVKEYNEATFNDETWGVYKKHGLKAKVEAAADYTNSSSLVEEFLDVLEDVYQEIEKDGRADGKEFDAPYQVAGSFPTVYGYHKIAIVKAEARTYAETDPDMSLGYEALRDQQLGLLTENVYKLYLEMKEDTFEDEKEEILKELGFDADYELDDQLKKAIEAYYVPAVEKLEGENRMDLEFSNIRETAVKEGLYVFTNNADKEYYLHVEALVRADLQRQIAKENE